MANPFDDDIADDALRNPAYKPKSGGGGGGGGGGGYTTFSSQPHQEEEEEQFNFYERQIEAIMQDSLASTGRSLRALEESEQIGVSTAENLLTQGEKLRKTEKNLDHIQATATQTQRHLNNIKSIFGGVKNYFSKSASAAAAKPSPSPSEDDFKSKTKLVGAVSDLQSDSSSSSSYKPSGQQNEGGSLPTSTKESLTGTRWGAMDDEIDDNLDLMAANLARLKDLGMGLGEEIVDQNKMIERIQVKAEKADIVIRDQDKQMKKIMGVKKQSAVVETKPGSAKEAASFDRK